MPNQYTGNSWQKWLEIAKQGKTDEECWLIPLSNGRRRYASYNAVNQLLHRIAYQEQHGQIPQSLKVCHSCHMRNCVNPRHLFIGTQKENMQSSIMSNWPNGIGGTPKLSREQVVEILKKHEKGETIENLSKQYGVTEYSINRIITRKTWKFVP